MKEIMDRFIEWVNKHGGPTPVAVTIGKSPQSFYNYTNRGSKPNMEIFALLANHYPDFDPDFILTGRNKSTAAAEEKLKEMEAKYHILQSMYERAVVEKAASMGKSKGAKLCPDTKKILRIEGAKQMMHNARRAGRKGSSKQVSVRVPGALIVPDLKELFSRPL